MNTGLLGYTDRHTGHLIHVAPEAISDRKTQHPPIKGRHSSHLKTQESSKTGRHSSSLRQEDTAGIKDR